jgi:hypothetical protein
MPSPMDECPWGSMSMSSVLVPALAKPAARLMLDVVLPVPPLWVAKLTIMIDLTLRYISTYISTYRCTYISESICIEQEIYAPIYIYVNIYMHIYIQIYKSSILVSRGKPTTHLNALECMDFFEMTHGSDNTSNIAARRIILKKPAGPALWRGPKTALGRQKPPCRGVFLSMAGDWSHVFCETTGARPVLRYSPRVYP